jgi:hypothetical protein
LKALLAVHNVNYPKIHDVTVLAKTPFSLAEFNPFAVTIRYDDLDLDNDLSLPLLQEMLAKVEQVRAIICTALPEVIRP